MVPGLHVARPWSRRGTRRASQGVRLHHALADGRHGRARPARTRRSSRLHAARRRSGSTRCSTARCTPDGPGTSCATTRSRSPTWSATAIRRTARTRSRSPPTSGSQFDQALSWHDIDWLRTFWDGPIVLKGIQTVADAKQAVAMGVQGIGMSNHGGRQLDDAPSPIELVEPVRQEIADQATIICDGGVRRGSDIVKAIALGADAVSVGSAVPVRPRCGRGTWRRPRPRVPARRFRAHDGAHRVSHRSPRSTAISSAGAPNRSPDPARDRHRTGPFVGRGGGCETARMSDRVLISITDGVADVRFNRADKRNALDNAMFQAIAEAGENLKSESGCPCRRAVRRRAVVLRRARLLVVPGDGRWWR